MQNEGFTALMLSSQNGHDPVYASRLKHLHLLPNPDKPFQNHEQCTRALIEAKADLEKVNKDSFTALMISAQLGHEPVRAFRF